MKIGFTGTRNGMTDDQKRVLLELLKEPNEGAFHHWSCRGADVEAAEIASGIGRWIVCHPGPEDDGFQTSIPHIDSERLPPKTHFARNRDIVDACDLLIGCPGAPTWQERGGTFYTMQYAIKRGKPVKVIWPDGRVEDR